MSKYFKVGDIVVSIYGKKPMKVTNIRSYVFDAVYLHNNNSKYHLSYHKFKLFEEENQIMTVGKLFSVKTDNGEETYATYLATNSKNQMILEEKGTGVLLTVDSSQVEEVIPWTFQVRVNSKNEHYVGNPDTIKLGDYLLFTDSGVDNLKVGKVTKVNTKNGNARSKLSAVKLVVESICQNTTNESNE